MKFYLFIVFLFFSSLVFANDTLDIQVMINGYVYQCSGNNSDNTCTTTANLSLSKFNACRNAVSSGEYCFKSAFVPKVDSCKEWSEACYNSCKSSINSGEYCFKNCY